MTYDNDLKILKWIVIGASFAALVYFLIGTIKSDESCKPVFNINYALGQHYDGFHCN